MVNKYNEKDTIGQRIEKFQSTAKEDEKIDMIFDCYKSDSKNQYMRVTGIVHIANLNRFKEFGIILQGMYGTASNELVIGLRNIEDEI